MIRCLMPVTHDGVQYGIGDELAAIDDVQARVLVEIGAADWLVSEPVSEVSLPPAAPAPKRSRR